MKPVTLAISTGAGVFPSTVHFLYRLYVALCDALTLVGDHLRMRVHVVENAEDIRLLDISQARNDMI